ncbi:hypothetical protein P4263_27695 [Bacillus thuringiensis]|nr:hypothetical protein [Bacillus thuringiensis]
MKIDKNSPDYVKIYRFDNKGFFCKPYNSDTYDHVFEFIDTEVTDLILFNQKILKKMSIHLSIMTICGQAVFVL